MPATPWSSPALTPTRSPHRSQTQYRRLRPASSTSCCVRASASTVWRFAVTAPLRSKDSSPITGWWAGGTLSGSRRRRHLIARWTALRRAHVLSCRGCAYPGPTGHSGHGCDTKSRGTDGGRRWSKTSNTSSRQIGSYISARTAISVAQPSPVAAQQHGARTSR